MKFKDLDEVNNAVVRKIWFRAEAGLRNYGVSMDRDDLSLLNWLQHLQEEMLDACVYIQKFLMQHEREHYAKTNQSNSSSSKEGKKVQG